MKLTAILATIIALFGLCNAASAADDYPLGPDSQTKPGVPQGEVTHYRWSSKIYPGTERDYWVYVPKQYEPSHAACVMVFQDGGGFQSRDGQFRVPVVFDNLIAAKQMPITVAIMIDPGVAPPSIAKSLPRYNRSHEYDAVTDVYAQFLIDEILPEVGKKLNLTKDPAGRALCGASSGGICSFIAAWERPDQFSKVVSFVGSFTDLQGGNNYASAIRKYEPRPIRVLLQDGSADQDIYSGVWFLGNTDVSMALKFAGNDVKFVTGTGGHNGQQGGSILPDALKWLWRDYPAAVARPAGNRQPVMEVVQPGEMWKLVPDIKGAVGIAADKAGDVYVSLAENKIVKISGDSVGAVTGESNGATSLAIGPDGDLWAVQPSHHKVVQIGANGREKRSVTGITGSSIVVSHTGVAYVTDDVAGKVWQIKDGKKVVADSSIAGAKGVTLTPDQSLLHVSTSGPGKWVYSYRINSSSAVTDKQQYFDIRLDYQAAESHASGMATDTQGRLYVTSNSGIQILDQAGRVIGILENPERTATTAVTFGGAAHTKIYVLAGGKVYSRIVKPTGVLPFDTPITPPGPRL